MPIDPNDPRFKDALEHEPDWDTLGTKDAMLSLARERFPIGCRIQHNHKAIAEFRKRNGRDQGVVLEYLPLDETRFTGASINLKVRFSRDGRDSYIHPCWVEKI